LRWTYIVLPAALLLITLALTAAFYPRMPEQVAYHFQDGAADRWLSRGSFIIWMVIPQAIFTLLAFIIVRVVLLGANYWPVDNTLMRKILPVMGNMVALPQIILTFTLIQVFLYNAYHIKLIPVWVFAFIILISGGIVLGVVFIQAIRQARRQRTNIFQE
jgi:uncharacterized membrane protein